jgi:hypothetical protein
VSHYHEYLHSLPARRPESSAVAELAELRRAAERTWFVVSTWGRPWSWLLAFDRAWTLILPHPAEPNPDSLEHMRREYVLLLLASDIRIVTRRLGIADPQLATAAFELFLSKNAHTSGERQPLWQHRLAWEYEAIAREARASDEQMSTAFEQCRSWLIARCKTGRRGFGP